MLYSKKGFTMISVGIMVVVTIILVATVSISAVSAIANAKKMNFSTDIGYIQDEVDNYYIKNGYINYPISGSITVNLSNVSQTIIDEQFIGETIDVNKKTIMNEINFDIIGIKQHVYGNNITSLDKYVISTKTGKVYYVEGIKAGGNTYYTMTPQLNKEYKRKVVLEPNQIALDDIIFELSTVEYTNSPVTVKVKLPNTSEFAYAISNPVVASDGKVVSTASTVGSYKEINVNYTTTTSGNYSIVVNYTKNGLAKTVRYMVNNFDATEPSISSISTISSRNPNDGVLSAYLSLSEATDNLSGIKFVKYIEENISVLADAKIYFQNNGKYIVDNKIKIKKFPIYTIYLEDNAGNGKVYNVTIDSNIYADIQ